MKQKLAGCRRPDKLRAIIPNTTTLRLLTNVVFDVVHPFSFCDSTEQVQTRVLGASKGGQPLDIASVAQLSLQCGRDNEDRAAFGKMDIRHFMTPFLVWRCGDRNGAEESLWSGAPLPSDYNAALL